MTIFLDTSVLFKLYHQEAGTETVEGIFAQYTINRVFLSEISKIEFASTIWKKVRMRDISENQAREMLAHFVADHSNYDFITADKNITTHAQHLISKYGKQGLRTLDSLQLSTSVSLKGNAHLFLTTDKLLHTLFEQELLPTTIVG